MKISDPAVPAEATDTEAERNPQSNTENDDDQPERSESGGPAGPEPTRFGDWERNGRCIDF